MSDFKRFRKSQIAEMRLYVEGEDMSKISISVDDQLMGSPKEGDYIARNPKNHEDMWLVSAKFVAENYEPAED